MQQTIETIYVTIEDEEHPIRVFGTSYSTVFAGKDLCKIMGYSNYKDTLQKLVQRIIKEI